MTSKAATTEEYLESLPEDRKEVMTKLVKTIKANLPDGFETVMQYGMCGFVVPHSVYPAGYHCTPKEPLPFMGLASQKNNISLYHMGLYADSRLLDWFTSEYPKYNVGKLDMGKSCIRFKKMDKIPFELIAELSSKMTPADWIALYERELKK
jgi:uncharacterized protein YdhG (YjbR/CyaY superfamily)